jgi:metal-responsive CopG/Arc/MetJ family transcriptional regulator
MKNDETQISFRLDRNLALEFRKILKKQDLTSSQVIRKYVREYVEKNKEVTKSHGK